MLRQYRPCRYRKDAQRELNGTPDELRGSCVWCLASFQSEIEVNRLWRHRRCLPLTPTFLPNMLEAASVFRCACTVTPLEPLSDDSPFLVSDWKIGALELPQYRESLQARYLNESCLEDWLIDQASDHSHSHSQPLMLLRGIGPIFLRSWKFLHHCRLRLDSSQSVYACFRTGHPNETQMSLPYSLLVLVDKPVNAIPDLGV